MAGSNEILLACPGSVTLMVVEVRKLVPLKLQLTDGNGVSGGVRVVVNFTWPPTAPLRGPRGKIPSPAHVPNYIEGQE